jgi:hypothetical protein
MIGSAIRRTLVQGGAGSGQNAREGRLREGFGDGFAESISSALERLVAPAMKSRTVPLGMEASIAPLVTASDDEEGVDPNALEAQERWGAAAALGRDGRPAEPARLTAPSQLYAATAGGMAVWEGPQHDAQFPFSESPSELPLRQGGAKWEDGMSGVAGARDLDADAMPLVTKRAYGEENLRTRPTWPEQLAGERASEAGGGQVARVGIVRVGPPGVRDRVGRMRPPSADTPAPRSNVDGSRRDDVSARDARDQPTERAGTEERVRGADARPGSSNERRVDEPFEARGERGRGSERERTPRAHGPAREHGSQADAERLFTSVHARPLVSVGDGAASFGAPSASPPESAIETGRASLPLESTAANGPVDAARVEAVPYHAVRLDDHTARVELMHPELGRVRLEVHTEQGRVDVELLARSLSASIALRASEPELRGDLRQRGASLRNYRVRTAADGSARALDERQR